MIKYHPTDTFIKFPNGGREIGDILGTYLTRDPMGLVGTEESMIFCGLYVMGVFKAAGRCLLSGLLIFADVACLWYPGGFVLLIIHTSLA